jgi:molybdate/tungstate transport system permease protein
MNKKILIAITGILLFHIGLFVLTPLNGGFNLLWLIVNIIFYIAGEKFVNKKESFFYLLGYFILLAIFGAILRSLILFALFLLLYIVFFHRRKILGYYIITIISLFLLQPYAIPCLIILSLFYAILTEKNIRKSLFSILSFTIGATILLIIIFPLLNFIFNETPQSIIHSMQDKQILNAFGVSFFTCTISTLIIIIFGTPLAHFLSRNNFRFKSIVESIIDLPILIPQSVAGIALAILLGGKMPLGIFFERSFGISFAGTLLGIIVVQIFVSAPFFIKPLIESFNAIEPRYENISRSLGESKAWTFFRVTMPMAYGGFFTGAIMAWARAMGEFGAVMIFCYYPFTIPVIIFDRFAQRGLLEAGPIVVLLILTCLWVFIVLRFIKIKFVFNNK